MALTITDLKYPAGEIIDLMFPDGVDVPVGKWLDEAVSLTTDVGAQAAYVYWRAFQTVATRLSVTPSRQSSNQGAHDVSWGDGRVQTMQDRADFYKAKYERLANSSELQRPTFHFGRVRVV